MPIRNCPITSLYGNNTLTLPVKIINPHTGFSIKTNGLIDTGATECAIPERMAVMLGHNLTRGIRSSINTGNGISEAYRHTSTILIYTASKQVSDIPVFSYFSEQTQQLKI
jgi:predicted aspartyl protease